MNAQTKRGPGSAAPAVLLALALAARPLLATAMLGEGRPLAAAQETAQHPAISPDGAKLAFVAERDGCDNLFIAPLAGGEPTPLTHETRAGVQISTPRWSPGGDYLVYASNKGPSGRLALWLIGADGKRDEALTKGPGVDWMPSWGGDGHAIAFVSDRDGGDALYTIAPDGGNLKRLAEMTYEPAVSPDGRLIAAYRVQATGADGLYLLAADGSGQPRLLLEGGRMPAWTPDGRAVVAVKTDAAGSRLWRVDVASGAAQPLSGPLAGLAWPSVGRGGAVAYEARPQGRKQLFVAEVANVQPVAAILEPAAGASVRGGVTVRGRVGTEAGRIAIWRLEGGLGAAPGQWTTIAEGAGSLDGVLGTWNTTGLEGLCTLRLTAISDAGETSVSTTQVTIYGQYGVIWQTQTVPATMSVGQACAVDLTLKNNGTMTWRTDGPYAVVGSYQWLDADGAVVVGQGPATPLSGPVAAGEPALLKAQITAPDQPGHYTLRYDLRQGDQVWFHEQGAKPLEVAVEVGVAYAGALEVPAVPAIMVPGQIYAVEVRLTNNGSATWQGQPSGNPALETVVLAARWRDVDGGLVDSPAGNTPLPQSVPPGQSLTVVAQVQAPSVNGRFLLSFELRDGAGLFTPGHPSVSTPQPVTVSSPYGVQFLDHNTPTRMFPGDLVAVNLQARNTGSLRWRADGTSAVRLTYLWLAGDGRVVDKATLPTALPYDVLPGQTAALSARLQSPADPGEYTLVWDLEQAGGRRFAEMGNLGLKTTVMVGAPTHGVRWEQARHPVEMVVDATYAADLRLTNIGAMTWPADGPDKVRLGYHWVRPDGQEVGQTPLFTDFEKPVDSGQPVKLTARVKAPDHPGHYLLKWDLYQTGFEWFSGRGAATLDVPVAVEVLYGAHWLSHDTPAKVLTGQRYKVNLRLQNTGTIPWEPTGATPLTLVYRWLDAGGKEVAVAEAAPVALPQLVQPGQTVEVVAYLQAPHVHGVFELDWDLQLAGTVLFSDKGVEPLKVPVTVE